MQIVIIYALILAFFCALIIAGILLYRKFPMHLIYKSKVHLQAAFDSLETPTAIIGKDYTILRVNKAYAQFVGLPFNKILHTPCYTALRKRLTPCEDCKMQEVLAKGKTSSADRSMHPTLSDRIVAITFYPFNRKKNVEGAIVENFRDITQLEQLKTDLEARNAALESTTKSLKTANDAMDEELKIARKIQLGIMPQKIPLVKNIAIDAMYHPIEAVGGDLYDFIVFNEHQLGIFIGDASGHGLASAFIGTISKMILYSHTKEVRSPEALLYDMNRDLMRHVLPGYYITCFWGIFDNRDNSLTFSRAGHPKPILISAHGEMTSIQASGTFVGIVDNPVYECKKITLSKGDRLFLFTDGIYEIMEGNQTNSAILGYAQFQKIVQSCNNANFKSIIPEIKKSLLPYVYEDDYTLLALEITDNPIA